MIEEVFGASGLLAQKFPGYAPRRGQLDMADCVRQGIAEGRHVIAEGPTGTGKSLAYLVPSIYAAVGDLKEPDRPLLEARNRVIVVTANIALQEQLVQADLPRLASVLPFPFRFGMMKGRNNYLCQDAHAKSVSDHLLAGGSREEKQMLRLLAWADRTETGDVSEFPETPYGSNWKKLAVSAEECKGSKCRYFETCHSEKARREALRSHVIVTNYHLFFAHLVVRAKMREIANRGAPVDVDVVLPPASTIILDEAHKAAEIAREFLGFRVAKTQVDWLVRGFKHELADKCRAATERFFSDALAFRKSRAYRSRLKKGHPLDVEPLASTLAEVGRFYREASTGFSWDDDEKAELEVRARRSAEMAAQLRQAARPEQHPNEVFFLEEEERGVSLKSKPVFVNRWMQSELFGCDDFDSVTITSATLSTGSGGFSYVKKELGLEESNAIEIVAESPFDWQNRVLLVVPDTMTSPDDRENFPRAVADHFCRAAENADGRTLGLFTSYRNLEQAYERFAPVAKVKVLKQGDGPRTKLVADFRQDVSSVLLGVESFWAGVDVPGESLSCVVIDRLPFPTPDDPIIDAIAETNDRWFFDHAIPRAIIQFKQGFGRLIRTTTDRGCVVVLDRRIIDKGYGRTFMNALPKTFFSRDVDDVRRFLESE